METTRVYVVNKYAEAYDSDSTYCICSTQEKAITTKNELLKKISLLKEAYFDEYGSIYDQDLAWEDDDDEGITRCMRATSYRAKHQELETSEIWINSYELL